MPALGKPFQARGPDRSPPPRYRPQVQPRRQHARPCCFFSGWEGKARGGPRRDRSTDRSTPTDPARPRPARPPPMTTAAPLPARAQQHEPHVVDGQSERDQRPAAANNGVGKTRAVGAGGEGKGGNEEAGKGGQAVRMCSDGNYNSRRSLRWAGAARHSGSCSPAGAGPDHRASGRAAPPLHSPPVGGRSWRRRGSPMAAAAERTDELVREYLLFRGFTAALKQLDAEIKADREKGFRVSGGRVPLLGGVPRGEAAGAPPAHPLPGLGDGSGPGGDGAGPGSSRASSWGAAGALGPGWPRRRDPPHPGGGAAAVYVRAASRRGGFAQRKGLLLRGQRRGVTGSILPPGAPARGRRSHPPSARPVRSRRPWPLRPSRKPAGVLSFVPTGTAETRVRSSGRRTFPCLSLFSVVSFLSSGFTALLLSLDVLSTSVEIGAEFAGLENTVSALCASFGFLQQQFWARP